MDPLGILSIIPLAKEGAKFLNQQRPVKRVSSARKELLETQKAVNESLKDAPISEAKFLIADEFNKQVEMFLGAVMKFNKNPGGPSQWIPRYRSSRDIVLIQKEAMELGSRTSSDIERFRNCLSQHPSELRFKNGDIGFCLSCTRRMLIQAQESAKTAGSEHIPGGGAVAASDKKHNPPLVPENRTKIVDEVQVLDLATQFAIAQIFESDDHEAERFAQTSIDDNGYTPLNRGRSGQKPANGSASGSGTLYSPGGPFAVHNHAHTVVNNYNIYNGAPPPPNFKVSWAPAGSASPSFEIPPYRGKGKQRSWPRQPQRARRANVPSTQETPSAPSALSWQLRADIEAIGSKSEAEADTEDMNTEDAEDGYDSENIDDFCSVLSHPDADELDPVPEDEEDTLEYAEEEETLGCDAMESEGADPSAALTAGFDFST
ncbi:hypothetical protein MKEN_00511400 [Mycena kentingensis (nom. inval.)]|nr:hypothetical protein MKEN_00511400 [Mycena kentingensis (nom. inval.)]